ncbi:MAG: hypothetical protein R3330_18170, partial [Saprospiraceae bacterium]|nr:hypothetical protein [Saprospiraceae bacterium]
VLFEDPVDRIDIEVVDGRDVPIPYSMNINGPHLLGDRPVVPNPPFQLCTVRKVTIALDGSKSMTEDDYDAVYSMALDLVHHMTSRHPIHLTILEFDNTCWTGFDRLLAPGDPNDLAALDRYLANRWQVRLDTRGTHLRTNWEHTWLTADTLAPDLLIFVADGWPNALTHHSLVLPMYGVERLVSTANEMKANGTTILVIGKQLAEPGQRSPLLERLTDGPGSTGVNGNTLDRNQQPDYIIVPQFEEVPVADLVATFTCPTGQLASEELDIFPNPSRGTLTIALPEVDLNGVTCRVVDPAGKPVSDFLVAQNANRLLLELTDPVPGQYVIVVGVNSRQYRRTVAIMR